MRSSFLTVVAFMLVPFGAASSQAVQPRNGDRIRITTAQSTLNNRIAHVLGVRPDSLLLLVAPAETLAVARASMTRLEVKTRRSHTRSGLGYGALIGVTSGAVMGYASGDDRGWCCFTKEVKAVYSGVGMGVAGMIVGAVVGASIVSDRWTSVPLGVAKATPNLQVGRGGTRLAVAISFQP